MNPHVQPAPTQRYTRLRELGRGGSAVVELAYDEVRHAALAVKRWERASAETRFRLKQQYRRGVTIRHPNVVRLYELFAEGETTCLTMEAVLGVDVRGYVTSAPVASRLAVLLDVLRQLTDALVTLHAAGIVHRDVKPSNVLVEADGRVVLMDGGFAWPRDNPFEPLDQHTLTCTVPYLAPECLQGALPNVEADWYGFAALAAELLTEQPPFGGSLQDIMRAKDESPEALTATLADVPHTLEALVCALLQRDPRSRPSPRIVQATLRELTRMLPLPPSRTVTQTVEIAAAQQEAATPPEASAVQDAALIPVSGFVHVDADVAREQDVAALQESPAAKDDALALELAQRQGSAPMHEVTRPAQDSALLPTVAPAPKVTTAGGSASAITSSADDASHTPISEVPISEVPISEVPISEVMEKAPSASSASPTQANLEAEDSLAADGVSPACDPLSAVDATAALDTISPLDAVTALDAISNHEALSPVSSADARAGALTLELAQLESVLDAATGPSFVCVEGPAASGKTKLLANFRERAAQHAGVVVASTHCGAGSEPYHGVAELLPQLLDRVAQVDAPYLSVLAQSFGYAALVRMFPALESRQRASCEAPPDPQRAFIEASATFSQIVATISRAQHLVLLVDDFQRCDADSARLLQGLLRTPNPQLSLVVAYRHAGGRAPTIRPAPEYLELRNLPPTLYIKLKASRAPAGNDNGGDEPTSTESEDPARAAFADLAAHVRAAEAATQRLALERAADLYAELLEASPDAGRDLLRAAAGANASAGRLRDAATCWLALAHTTQDRDEARSLELAAGAARMRAGDEQDGLALICNVLRACGVSWPRVPLIAAALDRVRAFWFSPRTNSAEPEAAQAALARFDALWTGAREVALLEPATGDALCARALRESQRLGDPSRVLWTLGYEAVWEANLGGNYLRKRATGFLSRVEALSQQTGTRFDAAYARSVRGVVAWFGGEWAAAETALCEALDLYALAPEPSAHERHVLESFLLSALEAQAKLPELRARLAQLQLAAEHTGHVQAAAMYALAELSLPALVQDQPCTVIARADSIVSRFAADEFTPVHFQHFVVTVSARLHAGHATQAFAQVEQLWQRLARSYFLRLDAAGVMLRQLRARAALALAKQSTQSEAQRLCKLAAKEASVIGRSGLLHAQALEHLIDCSVANMLRQNSAAQAHCAAAVDVFDRAGMPLMREISRYAGSLLSRDPGQAQRDRHISTSYFHALGVQNPHALVAAWFPTLDV